MWVAFIVCFNLPRTAYTDDSDTWLHLFSRFDVCFGMDLFSRFDVCFSVDLFSHFDVCFGVHLFSRFDVCFGVHLFSCSDVCQSDVCQAWICFDVLTCVTACICLHVSTCVSAVRGVSVNCRWTHSDDVWPRGWGINSA